jgi:predicted Zn-dependent protease
MNYKGILLDDSLELGRCSGKITIYMGEAVFEGENIIKRVSLSSASIERGGAANRLIFFKPTSHSEFSFYTDDKKILKDPNLKGTIEKAKTSDSIFSGSLPSLALVVVLFTALMVAFFVFAREPLVRWTAQQIPPKYEKKLGALAWESYKNQSGGMIEDSLLLEHLDEMVKPIVEGIGETRFPLKFHISRDSLVNAFALPGGYMVINAGLINKADSVEEVLGVVAHEIAHVEKQHSMRQIINTTGMILMVQTLLGDMSGIIALLTQQGAFLLQQSYSRDFETEADIVGLDYLKRSKIAPGGLVTFFEKIKAIQDKSELKEVMDSDIFDYFSTHPSTDSRIEYLKDEIKSLDEPNGGWIKNDAILNELQDRLKELK